MTARTFAVFQHSRSDVGVFVGVAPVCDVMTWQLAQSREQVGEADARMKSSAPSLHVHGTIVVVPTEGSCFVDAADGAAGEGTLVLDDSVAPVVINGSSAAMAAQQRHLARRQGGDWTDTGDLDSTPIPVVIIAVPPAQPIERTEPGDLRRLLAMWDVDEGPDAEVGAA